MAFDADYEAKAGWIDAVVNGSARTDRIVPPPDATRPTEQLLCLDDSFYIRGSAFPASDYFLAANSTSRKYPRQPFGDVDMFGWTAIGQYLHFLPSVHAMADTVLREIMQLAAGQAIPPFIAVHLRRGDFGTVRTQVAPFAQAVEEIRGRLDEAPDGRWRGRAHELSVVAATDGVDPAFLGEIRGHGWHLLNHNQTRSIERFGVWAPTSASACRAR